jgi:hypothetical protein
LFLETKANRSMDAIGCCLAAQLTIEIHTQTYRQFFIGLLIKVTKTESIRMICLKSAIGKRNKK